jgi:hypothetical protein
MHLLNLFDNRYVSLDEDSAHHKISSIEMKYNPKMVFETLIPNACPIYYKDSKLIFNTYRVVKEELSGKRSLTRQKEMEM